MKLPKNSYLILILIPLVTFLLVASASGPPPGKTGSPGDEGVTCTQCHTSTGNFGASVTVTTDIPEVEGYTKGETYLVTIEQISTASVHGFQVVAENSSGDKIGTFASLDANTQEIGSGDYAEHTSTGINSSTWRVNWTAPSTDAEPVVFYVASNAADGDGTNNGDQIVTNQSTSFGVLATGDVAALNFNLYPNPGTENLQIILPEITINANYEIYDYMGRTIVRKHLFSHENDINISNLKTGMYWIRLENDQKSAIKAFLKQ